MNDSVNESCCNTKTTTKTKAICPNCNNSGKKVDILTVKALVKEGEVANIQKNFSYYYCSVPDCKTVYYNENNSVFDSKQIKTIIGDKNPSGYICYCFGFTTKDLKNNHDNETFIRKHVKAGNCACEVKNIHGTCCLGDVLKVLKGN